MGACCTGKETKSEYRSDEINWKIFKTQCHSELRHVTTPKIDTELDNSFFSLSLNNLIQKFQNCEYDQIQKISMERLWNIHKFYLDDYTNSDFILCDLRDNSDKTENFLKKFKTINYGIDEIKMLNENQQARFKKFLNAKNLIVILKEEKMKIFEEMIKHFYDKKFILQSSTIFIIDNNMSINDLNRNNKKLYELQDTKIFRYFPFVLFPLKIFPHLKAETFIFFDFFSLDNLHQVELLNKTETKNKPHEITNFIQNFNIANVLIIKNKKSGDFEDLSHKTSNNIPNIVSKSAWSNFSKVSSIKIKNENAGNNSNTKSSKCKLIKLFISSMNEFEENQKDFLNFQFFSIRKDIISSGSLLILMDDTLGQEIINFMIFLTAWKIADVKPKSIKDYIKDNFMYVKNLGEFCQNAENIEQYLFYIIFC